MKTSERISRKLGLTQEQLAMLLGTTRSRISLFELGIRMLPNAAQLRLSKLVTIATNPEAEAEKKQHFRKGKEGHLSMFDEMLQKNKVQQSFLIKKISQLQEKQSNDLKGQELLDYLAYTKTDKDDSVFLFMPGENRKAKHLRKKAKPQILKSELKLKVLQYEEQLLKEAMGTNG